MGLTGCEGVATVSTTSGSVVEVALVPHRVGGEPEKLRPRPLTGQSAFHRRRVAGAVEAEAAETFISRNRSCPDLFTTHVSSSGRGRRRRPAFTAAGHDSSGMVFGAEPAAVCPVVAGRGAESAGRPGQGHLSRPRGLDSRPQGRPLGRQHRRAAAGSRTEFTDPVLAEQMLSQISAAADRRQDRRGRLDRVVPALQPDARPGRRRLPARREGGREAQLELLQAPGRPGAGAVQHAAVDPGAACGNWSGRPASARTDIVVYDASRLANDSIFLPAHAEFPGIRFEDRDGGDGRFQDPARQERRPALRRSQHAGQRQDLPARLRHRRDVPDQRGGS